MPVALGQRIGGDGGGCRHFRVVQAMLCMVQAMHSGAADFAPLCSPPPSPHDSRLAGLGARVGDRGGVEDESTFSEPFPSPCKGPCKRAI